MNTIKNIILFIALWIFCVFIVDSIGGGIRITDNYDDDKVIYGLAIAILITYVWNRLIKRVDRK